MKIFYRIPPNVSMRPVMLIRSPRSKEYTMVETTPLTIQSKYEWFFQTSDIVKKYRMRIPGITWDKKNEDKLNALVLLRDENHNHVSTQVDNVEINAFYVGKKDLERI